MLSVPFVCLCMLEPVVIKVKGHPMNMQQNVIASKKHNDEGSAGHDHILTL